MYSRSTNSNTGTALLLGCVLVLFVVVIKPLLTTFSIPLTYSGSWWRFASATQAQFPAHSYKLPDSLAPNVLVVESKQELFLGKKIYTPSRELLGSLFAVKKIGDNYFGWVELLSSNQEKVLVTFLVEGVLTNVEARGRGQGVFVAQLPGVVKIEEGTTVTLSSSGDLVGQVVGTRSNQQDPFQRIFISPKTQLRSIPGFFVE